MKKYGRLLSLLLLLALLLPALPVGARDTGMPDYELADEIFEGLYARLLERKAPGTAAARAEAAARYLARTPGVEPESLRRYGDALTWMTTDGVACHFSPRLYALATENQTPTAEQKSTTAQVKAPSTIGRDVYLFAPYYELDKGFEGEDGAYDTWSGILAHFTGGNYYKYLREEATIDALADALEEAAVVLIDSHGDTETGTADALSSYICLQSGAGITTADYAYDEAAGVSHAYYGGSSANGAISYYEVDGTAIANHMEKPAAGGLLWNGICYGMSTQGISAPLMEQGLGVIYGYSQEVSFGGDRYWLGTAMDELTSGKTFHQALAVMKNICGAWDYSPQICEQNRWPASWVNHTAAQAAANEDAFPVVVSAKDSYPANPNALCSVYSDWQLPRLTLTLTLQVPDGVKQPAIEAYVFYTGTLPTPAGRPRNQDQDYRFAGWSLHSFAPQSRLPEPSFQPGELFSFGYYEQDLLSFGDHSATLYAIYSYQDAGGLHYTTQVPDGPYDPYDPSSLFVDMPFGSWYYDAVRYATAESLVNGYPDNSFRPNATIRRSEVVSLLYRAAGQPEAGSDWFFTDVDPESWYGPAVAWAAEQGIAQGFGDGSFLPDQVVTRAQLASFLYRYAGAEPADSAQLSTFPDQDDVPSWAQDSLSWAVEKKLIQGNKLQNQIYLQPNSQATRAQFVAILERYLSE